MAISSKSVALKKFPKLLSAELFVWFNLSLIAELFLRNWRHSTDFTLQEKCCAMTSMLQIRAGIQSPKHHPDTWILATNCWDESYWEF